MIRRVALTGGIATGKSHVRARLEALGVPTIDSDVLARQAVAPGTEGLTAVVDHFGRGVLRPDGTLDREKVAKIVFADADARKALEAIVHPVVRDATHRWFAALDADRHAYAVADIPLFYEVGGDRSVDAVIVVACDPETQVQRVMERDGVSEADARERVAAQLPIDQKVRRADYVIRTDGSVDDTNRQVDAVFEQLGRWRDVRSR